MTSLNRIKKEFQTLSKEDNSYNASPLNPKDLYKWQATIMGPKDSPYEGGKFVLNLNYTKDYPFKPPHVYFVTKIYHPNIDNNG